MVHAPSGRELGFVDVPGHERSSARCSPGSDPSPRAVRGRGRRGGDRSRRSTSRSSTSSARTGGDRAHQAISSRPPVWTASEPRWPSASGPRPWRARRSRARPPRARGSTSSSPRWTRCSPAAPEPDRAAAPACSSTACSRSRAPAPSSPERSRADRSQAARRSSCCRRGPGRGSEVSRRTTGASGPRRRSRGSRSTSPPTARASRGARSSPRPACGWRRRRSRRGSSPCPIARPPDHVARRLQAHAGAAERDADPPLRRQAGSPEGAFVRITLLRTARPRCRRSVRLASRGGAERSPAASSSTPIRRVARARTRHASRARGRRAPSCRRSWSPNAGPCGPTTSGRSWAPTPDVVDGAVRLGGWWVQRDLLGRDRLGAHGAARHVPRREPAAAGESIATTRRSIADAFAAAGAPRDLELADAVIDRSRPRARSSERAPWCGSRPTAPDPSTRSPGWWRSFGARRADTAVDRRAPRDRCRRRRRGGGGAFGRPGPDLAGARVHQRARRTRGRSSARPARTASRQRAPRTARYFAEVRGPARSSISTGPGSRGARATSVRARSHERLGQVPAQPS